MYNQRVVTILAKSRVKFETQLGNVMTLEEAIKIETEKIKRLSKENTSRY
tara:strand:+ start:612 stop:761 length:150 start_codon:yes stop_codon:yes gene_type:complete